MTAQPVDISRDQKFSLVVKRAVMIPEVAAIREFAKELKAEFDADPTLKAKFKDDPQAFLSVRGLAADLQREILVESGLFSGSDFNCVIFSCIVSDGCIFTSDISILL